MSICLCMIVKNEEHIIEKTLDNILKYIPLSHWVISDTGSTDNTISVIKSFFEKKGIPGELVEHEWKDFAYNRTKSLECAFNKTDYVFIFDADDEIIGQLKLPPLTKDRYMLTFGTGFSYDRPLLVTNRKPWFYTGVLHEYLDSPEPRAVDYIKGNYYIESGRTGSRSKNPNKYAEDAIVLKTAYETEPRKDLKCRYAFYCAQSYKDSGNPTESITWYKTSLELQGWDQEKYYACLQLGDMYEPTNMEMAQYYWSKSTQYDPERIEGLALLATMLHKRGNHVLVNALYHRCKDVKVPQGKLFIRVYLYGEIEYLNSISAYYARDSASGYACCKKIILTYKDKSKVDQCIKNLVFYKDFLVKDKSFMKTLSTMNVPKFIL
jgi:glycosyltransferase involved in cell wall biosynthesis